MIRVFKHYFPYNVVLLCLVDLLLLAAAGESAWRLRVSQIGSSNGPLWDRLPELGGFALVVWLAIIAVGGYSPEALRSIRFGTARLLVAVSVGVMGISLINFFVPGTAIWRSVLLYAMAIAMVALVGNRLLATRMLGSETFRRRILVLGAGERAARLQRLAKAEGSGFNPLKFIDMGDCPPVVDGAVERSAIGDLGRFVERIGAGEVVLALQERRNALPLKDLLRVKTKGVLINDFSSFLERETGRVDLDTLNPSWLIFSDGFSAGRRISAAGKRVFDIISSLLILIVGLPLIVIFGAAVKLDSKGPIFFRQRRVGLYGQEFQMVKLRSMRTDAEAGGAKWAEEDDPRITRVGRIIRKLRIDELPQLWSVLKGHMSFVGPRPEVPAFVAQLERELPYYAERHEVKPGITGWAQINFPYGASIEDARQKLEYDLYYAKNYTPFLDLLILLQTARVILWPHGAR
ncbi:TIGR03013 family PEP-CTERM/XrtA system glycosyltransferase [Qipengyuania sp. XHP0211]|uniref:TIGR03013 family XrtA/PEP-CTERM system glycosyltransferase n=1 Tax=Qipengyuania sp. XHP0211 TaxID=3038079 RepID=UPI00241C287E|nr:TIGR03013 family XrtA/PEP-CTERM system glycosyltransferase [Qipengyuania sp. XHP0211]MDG5749517.1 TIGR03013 family PEP-CTERM/XrtA system glycosyltransferase [Qipengyuania sp. XHP0211]